MAEVPHWRKMLAYRPEGWRKSDSPADDTPTSEKRGTFVSRAFRRERDHSEVHPSIREQTRVLELLGHVNYKIIKGKPVYVEVNGVVYKTLYGGYWRSVFTGIEHYLLRCEQVSGSVWAAEDDDDKPIDLPIAYSHDGWTASGYSLSFMLSRE